MMRWRKPISPTGQLTTLTAAAVAAGLLTAGPPPPAHAEGPGNCPNTAAAQWNWGAPNRTAEFDDPSALQDWYLYSGPGYQGNGRLTADAARLSNGALTITGQPNGDTEGMAWRPGQLYGRWEACVRSDPGSANYHPVLLLWPDGENQPDYKGEIDFMEIWDPSRQVVTANVHDHQPGTQPGDDQPDFQVGVDATAWHSWAVEWTPVAIIGFIDGRPWFRVDDPRKIPRAPMHMTIQLDDFGGDISQGGRMSADWARQYR